MHLGLAAQTLDVGLEVTLIRSDRAAQSVVILERSTKPEGKYGRKLEAVCDDSGVILGCLLVHPCTVFRAVFGDDDGQIAGGEEECLVTEHARNPSQGHRTAMPAKFRKCLSFCNAIGVPCHVVFLPKRAEGSNRPIRKLVMKLIQIRRLLGSYSCN